MPDPVDRVLEDLGKMLERFRRGKAYTEMSRLPAPLKLVLKEIDKILASTEEEIKKILKGPKAFR